MDHLGFFSLCLQSSNLAKTVAFYRNLEFEPTGEDAPRMRYSLKMGPCVLTFMSFLRGDLLHFRGAHIHRLMTQIEKLGIEIHGYNAVPHEQRLIEDKDGIPLPENECGHFTIYDPDGYEIFFNTQPEERQPFDEALDSPYVSHADEAKETRFGEFMFVLYVEDMERSMDFYASLGLTVTPIFERCLVRAPSDNNAFFQFLLTQSGEFENALTFSKPVYDELWLRRNGFELNRGFWHLEDPDGRPILLTRPRQTVNVDAIR